MGSSMWVLITIVGPVLLIAVVLWAIVSNRRSRRDEQRTERATHNLYEEIDREDKAAGRTEP